MSAHSSFSVPRLVAVAICAVTLSACESAKDVLGLSKSSPDESQVTVFSPLVVPPDFGLRPPAPGAVETNIPRPPRGPSSGAVVAADGTVIGGLTGTETVPVDVSAGELALMRQTGSLTPPKGVRGIAAQQERAVTRMNRMLTELVVFQNNVVSAPTPDSRAMSKIEKQGLFF